MLVALSATDDSKSRSSSARIPSSISGSDCGGSCDNVLPVDSSTLASVVRRIDGLGLAGLNFGLRFVESAESEASAECSMVLLFGGEAGR